VKELFVEYQGKEDKAILGPLARAHGFDQGSEHKPYFT
jgi:hypothetical protein